MHCVKVVNLFHGTVLFESAATMVVNLFEIVSLLDEDRTDLTAGCFNSTVPLVGGSAAWNSILVQRRVGGHFQLLNWDWYLIAPVSMSMVLSTSLTLSVVGARSP